MARPGLSHYYVTPFTTPPSEPNARPTQRRYHYLDYQPPPSVPQKATILLLHGFPDTCDSWRHMVAPLSFAGYRLIAPDLLGYGQSSAPPTASDTPGGSRLTEYGGRAICNDLDGLLNHARAGFGAEYGSQTCDSQGRNGRVIVLSHDWGGWLGWKTAQWIPHRIMGVTSLCVPHQAPTSKPLSIDQVIQLLPNFGYQKFFAEERSTKIIEANLERFLKLTFMVPGLFSGDSFNTADGLQEKVASQVQVWHHEGQLEKLLTDPELLKLDLSEIGKCVLTPEELQRYVTNFRERGMEGPLSWYRTRLVNWKEDRALTEAKLPATLPAMLLQPTEDIAVPPSMGKTMPKHAPSVKLVEIPGSGHFVQNELPNVVVAHVKAWIDDVVIPSEKKGSWIHWIKSKL